MKNKIIAILAVVFFVAAVVIGNFCNFENSDILALALYGFGLVATVYNVVNKQKEKGGFTWLSGLTIGFALVGGGLACLGGLTESTLETISGLVLALLAVFLSLLKSKK